MGQTPQQISATSNVSGKIKVKDFEIKSEFTGNRLQGYENQVAYYLIYKPTGKRIDKKFYHRKEAQKWLSKTVKAANEIKDKKALNEKGE